MKAEGERNIGVRAGPGQGWGIGIEQATSWCTG